MNARFISGILISAILVGCHNNVGDETPYENITYSELYTSTEDGSNIRQLTFNKNFIHYADFIPNSNKIFFVQTGIFFEMNSEHGGKQELCTYDFENGNIDTIVEANIYQNLLYVNESNLDNPKFVTPSPDGKKIYFMNRYPNWSDYPKDIYVVDLATKQTTNLTNTGSEETLRHFGLSFDGTEIVYSAYKGYEENSSLYFMNSDGSNKRLLASTDTGNFYYPQILSDNQTIVFFEPYKHVIQQINIDSLKISKVIPDSVYVYFFPELTKEDNIIIQKNDSGFKTVILNISTAHQSIIPFPSVSAPFFDKEGRSILYFENPWVLKKMSINGEDNGLIFDRSENQGSGHVPKESYSKDRIIFIVKNVFRIKWGDKK